MTKQLCTQTNLNLPKTYLPTYLSDSSYCRDSRDSSDSIDISDSSDSSEEKNLFFTKKLFPPENFFFSLSNLFTQKIMHPLHTKNYATSSHKKSSNISTKKVMHVAVTVAVCTPLHCILHQSQQHHNTLNCTLVHCTALICRTLY